MTFTGQFPASTHPDGPSFLSSSTSFNVEINAIGIVQNKHVAPVNTPARIPPPCFCQWVIVPVAQTTCLGMGASWTMRLNGTSLCDICIAIAVEEIVLNETNAVSLSVGGGLLSAVRSFSPTFLSCSRHSFSSSAIRVAILSFNSARSLESLSIKSTTPSCVFFVGRFPEFSKMCSWRARLSIRWSRSAHIFSSFGTFFTRCVSRTSPLK
mmetsp:Transcript_49280/g.100640  ORF Transcript_49280/g.100640 Transcript_49280/m.100640 type:complete len:210 (-) Transcript_49280:847-1476(-)